MPRGEDFAGLYRASNQSIQHLVGGQIKLACGNFALSRRPPKVGLRAAALTRLTSYLVQSPSADDRGGRSRGVKAAPLIPNNAGIGESIAALAGSLNDQ